ncbi:hypothetical protein [uncultured Rubinisphaera sp.]|uniref:hypothetical protein n=1 Tax=uncultured Rubinisphaera sp. TaxID=1678686 RepID=UPI0030DD759D|tara:strand:- start:110 stop:766 length:657 start_codon:yes stop_codon:yes gene_type:complete
MITPSDKDYQIAKQIKRGERSISHPYSELAEWIREKYSVNVLNVSYSKIKPDNRPRLSIDLETKTDRKVFEISRFSNDSKKSKRVVQKFSEILENSNLVLSLKDIFVIFTDFESVARVEANENVPEEQANSLIPQFDKENIWCVQKLFSSLIIFYHTEAEREQAVKSGMIEKYCESYSKIIKPYDEFGYLNSSPVIPGIDSKENLDKNYGGSWFYYWR